MKFSMAVTDSFIKRVKTCSNKCVTYICNTDLCASFSAMGSPAPSIFEFIRLHCSNPTEPTSRGRYSRRMIVENSRQVSNPQAMACSARQLNDLGPVRNGIAYPPKQVSRIKANPTTTGNLYLIEMQGAVKWLAPISWPDKGTGRRLNLKRDGPAYHTTKRF